MNGRPIVLICGDRSWSDRDMIRERLRSFPPEVVVIHGACRGADTIASEEATARGLSVRAFPADWAGSGRAAGPLRNRRMLDEKPLFVIAFHDDLARSRGTKDCVEEARRRGIPVQIVSHAQPLLAFTP